MSSLLSKILQMFCLLLIVPSLKVAKIMINVAMFQEPKQTDRQRQSKGTNN